MILSLSARAHENAVLVPMFEDDTYVVSPSNRVAPIDRSISEFISFSGAVIDETTGLAWQKTADGELKTWREAYEYCRSIRLVNQNHWRLPTLVELYSILNLSSEAPAINESVFLNTKYVEAEWGYWTSTRDLSVPTTSTAIKFFTVHFRRGRVDSLNDNDTPAFAGKSYARCVL